MVVVTICGDDDGNEDEGRHAYRDDDPSSSGKARVRMLVMKYAHEKPTVVMIATVPFCFADV